MEERMKRIVWLLILSVLLFASSGKASELPDFPFVYATGEAELEVSPDMATIAFRVEAFDKEPSRAAATVEERSKELVSLFAKSGIDKKDIVAYELTKTTVREKKDYTELGILGYETSRRFAVTMRSLVQYGDFVASLLNLKNLTNLDTTFDTTRRKAVEAELTAQASVNAREQAEALAKGFGTQVLSVFAITTSDMGFLFVAGQFGMGISMEREAAKIQSRASMSSIFIPSTIKLQKAVKAIFKLKV
jgi:uncharacterized protein